MFLVGFSQTVSGFRGAIAGDERKVTEECESNRCQMCPPVRSSRNWFVRVYRLLNKIPQYRSVSSAPLIRAAVSAGNPTYFQRLNCLEIVIRDFARDAGNPGIFFNLSDCLETTILQTRLPRSVTETENIYTITMKSCEEGLKSPLLVNLVCRFPGTS